MKPAAFLACLALLAGCATPAEGPTLVPVNWTAIPGWSTDGTAEAFAEFRQVCSRLAVLPPDQPLGGTGEAARLAGTPAAYAPSCLAARQVLLSNADDARSFFERWFTAYAAGTVSVSGYDEPELSGSLTRTGPYQTAVLGRPADLVTVASANGHAPVSGHFVGGLLVPEPTRAAIDGGALAGRGLELLWLSSPVDLFFLQLQGSGRVRLPSGQTVRLAYAGKNGQPYVPLGRVMVERGLLAADAATPEHIRTWLDGHPAQAVGLLEQNPNYVFFRLLDDLPLDQGAPGALGVPLAPLRSVAVDRSTLPLAVPVFFSTAGAGGEQLRALAFATDASGDEAGRAIDVFTGWGQAARQQAGALHGLAHLVVLLPRPVGPAG